MKIFATLIAFIVSLFITAPTSVPTPIPSPTLSVDASPTPTAKPTPTPRSINLAPKPSLNPTPKPSVSPTPTSNSPDCSGYDTSAPSASVKVTFTSKTSHNNTLKVIQIHSKPGCKMVNGGSAESKDNSSFSDQGESSFGSLYPGSYTVNIKYGTNLTSTSMVNVNTSSGQTSTVAIEIP